MAYCTNCGKEISSEAVMCPQCGHPGPNAPSAAVGAGQLAGWWIRVGAMLVDFLVFVAVGVIIALMLVIPRVSDGHITVDADGTTRGMTPEDVRAFALAFLLLFSFQALYKLLMEGRSGQTLGKKAAGIRVVRADDGGQISYGKAFFRWFISFVLNLVNPAGLLDGLWPLWDERNQTLHDKAAGTIVIKTR